MNWGNCVVNGVATLQCVPIIFSNLINAGLIFAGATALVFIIIAGLKLLTSGGDQKKVADAKGTLTWAIVGLILILLSFTIVNFISYLTNVDCIKQVGFDTCK